MSKDIKRIELKGDGMETLKATMDILNDPNYDPNAEITDRTPARQILLEQEKMAQRSHPHTL